MVKNAVGRELPEKIGNYVVKPYMGPGAELDWDKPACTNRVPRLSPAGGSKVAASLKDAIIKSGLKDGQTISFHHCFREGDHIIGQVLTICRELGLKNLTFAPSAVVNVKNPSVIDFVKDGTISNIQASGIRGSLGDGVLEGCMENPVILRSHGARPRAIEMGELSIDVAFIGASAADDYGNCTGQIGPNACGSLGYAMIDAYTAKHVIVVTDNLVDYPCCPASISQMYVDQVAVVEDIGDPAKIGAGAARMTKNPRDLNIAAKCAEVITASRRFKDGFSFQTGVGAIPIAATIYLSQKMEEQGIQASFTLGGTTSNMVDMFRKGQIRVIESSQSFDAIAARAIIEEPNIVEIDNALYADPYTKGSILSKLDFGLLAALEVDTDFNVNILTGSSGEMMAGMGGGPDVAADAAVSIVVVPIVRGRTPSITKRVFTCCTPGDTIAMVITEAGIALNPKYPLYEELKEDLEKTNLKLVTIEELQQLAESLCGTPKPIETTDKVCVVVEYRDGTVIDVIRQIKK